MLFAMLGLISIFVFLIGSEIAWRKKLIKGEISRKWVHIIIASFVAVWPFFTDTKYVIALSVAFFVVICLSKRLKIFRSIHSVSRATIGELLFPIAILVCALYAQNDWIFLAAVLHLSLADGLAAVFGTLYGKANRYYVLGQQKSLIGSFFFLTTSILIIQAFLLFGTEDLAPGTWILALVVPVAALVLENFSPYGTDNLTVPLFVMAVLNAV